MLMPFGKENGLVDWSSSSLSMTEGCSGNFWEEDDFLEIREGDEFKGGSTFIFLVTKNLLKLRL